MAVLQLACSHAPGTHLAHPSTQALRAPVAPLSHPSRTPGALLAHSHVSYCGAILAQQVRTPSAAWLPGLSQTRETLHKAPDVDVFTRLPVGSNSNKTAGSSVSLI